MSAPSLLGVAAAARTRHLVVSLETDAPSGVAYSHSRNRVSHTSLLRRWRLHIDVSGYIGEFEIIDDLLEK